MNLIGGFKLNKTGIFILGLIGSIMGILGSVIWMFWGTFFFGGMFDHDQPINAPLTDGALTGGLIVAGIQSIITISFFIVTLIKSTPTSLDKGLKNSAIWLLVLGILICVLNIFHLIPCTLLIIAGALGLQGANRLDSESPNKELTDEKTI